jgi:drug/metabolite transporter superfamily protein YnfA
MEYLFVLLLLGIAGGLFIWYKTRRKKYVIIYAVAILTLLFLPWLLLFIAAVCDTQFRD